MILEFSVRNFNSIKEEQTLSFLPSDRVTGRKNKLLTISDNIKIINNMLITGLTNSGKSNILYALDWIARKVRYPSYAIEIETFRYDSACKWLYTDFKLCFLLDKKQYLYEVSLNKNKVVTEKLSDITAENTVTGSYIGDGIHLGQHITLFNRIENRIDCSMYPTAEIQSTHLYLTDLFQHINGLKELFSGLVINYFSHGFRVDFFEENQIKLVNELLKSVDLDYISLVKEDKIKVIENEVDITSGISLSYGINQFLWLINALIEANTTKSPIICDISLVIDVELQQAILKIAEALKVQLVLVTNSNQLFDFLDADQINICQRTRDNSTEIFCLSDFDVEDINLKPLRRWHEAGKFTEQRHISNNKIENSINKYLNNNVDETDL
jgi:hypothetical protein